MKVLCKLGLWASLMGLLAGSPALAIIITLQPNTQTMSVGDPLTVDILALLEEEEIVAAFDLDLSYDPTLLTATGVTFGTALGDPDPLGFEVLTDTDLATVGLANFAAVSFLWDADLRALQSPPGSITLASLAFNVIGTGTSLLKFINYGEPGKDIKGADNVPYASPNLLTASITANGTIPVPEPSPLLLIGAGLAGMVGIRRWLRR